MEEQDVLQFFAFSADKPAGNGAGDKVNDKSIYKELNNIKNWRKMFSSFWAESFEFNGCTYLSFEHAYQAAKFEINGYNKIAHSFTLESEHPTSVLKGKQVQKAGRQVTLNGDELEKWSANMRSTKKSIYRAKFTLDTTPGKALISTKNAQLINYGPRIRKIRCTRMETLRDELIFQL